MKKTRQTLLILTGLLLAASLTLSACQNPRDPSAETEGQTTVTDTDSATPPDTEETTEEATESTAPPSSEPETAPVTETTPETEPETQAPQELTAEEAKTLLSAAFEADKQITDGKATIKMLINGEEVSLQTITQKGSDFHYVNSGMDSVEDLIVLGDRAYFVLSYDDGEYSERNAYLVKLTEAQKQRLHHLYIGKTDEEQNNALYSGVLEGTLIGTRHSDGTVHISTTIQDGNLASLLLGMALEGAELSFDFTLSPEGLMTFMRFTVTIPAEVTMDEDYVVCSETTIDYNPSDIQAPANTSAYHEVSYEEVFHGIPEIDPESAEAIGLPLDGDNYTIGGADSPYDTEAQFHHFTDYAQHYLDKQFTLYGWLGTDDWGDPVLTLGYQMNIWLTLPADLEIPANGTYVKLTATYSEIELIWEDVPYTAHSMVVTSVEPIDAPAEASIGKIMFVTAAALNVRSTPDSSIEENKVGFLTHGEEVCVLASGYGEEGNWCKILFDCDQGYAFISMKYLSENQP